jgi:hypothetical protein
VSRRLLCASLVALGAAASAGGLVLAQNDAQKDARGDRGALAVLRRDGVMFPFVSFERDVWEVSWPLGLRDVKIPETLKDIPKQWWGKGGLEGWRAHLLSGESIPLTVRALGAFRPFCVDRFGLATTYKSSQPAVATTIRPYPKDGIAVHGNVPIDPIETVDPAGPEAQELLQRLVKDFNEIENRTVQQVRSNTGWRHQFDDEARPKFPIRLESWYRSPSDEPGATVSYIEVSRAFPPSAEDKGCGLETFVSGWVHHFRGQLEKASELRGKITYCDRVGVVYMFPFGRVRPRTRDYWIFQLSGWNDEWYDVAEVRRGRVRYAVEVNAGGCRF